MRPTDPSQYIRAEKPCRRCGTIWRHHRGTCVECSRRRNARKYAERMAERSRVQRLRGEHKTTPQRATKRTPQVNATMPMHRSAAEIRFGFQVSSYLGSTAAIERSRHLDRLIRVHSEKGNDSPAMVTAGDLHRASLRVGAAERDTSHDYPRLKSQRHAENDALAAAIEKVRPTLADLVTVDDVLGAVPPQVVEPIMPTRRRYAASSAMAQLGIVKVKPGQRGRHRYFAVRDLARYRAVRAVDLIALHAKMNGLPPPPPPVIMTRKMALASGQYSYQREIPCPRCGGHEYKVVGSRCAACEAEQRHRQDGARAAAKATGEPTYVGIACQRCGGTLRWTSNYACVECTAARRASWDRDRATETATERAAGRGSQSTDRPAGANGDGRQRAA